MQGIISRPQNTATNCNQDLTATWSSLPTLGKKHNLSSKSNFTIERGHYSYWQQDNKQTLDLFWKSRTGNHTIRLQLDIFLKHIPHHVTCLLKWYSWLPHCLLNNEQTSQKACHGLAPTGSPAPPLTPLPSHASATRCIPPYLHTLPWS